MRQEDRIHFFVQGIDAWFRRHKRTLPWRDLKESDPEHRAYLVLVSEVMLQQTQVSRVLQLYKNFVRTFPTIVDLSHATNAEILIAWRGLGYNSRALRLRDAARCILRQHGGVFPRDEAALRRIPGIGPYTAAAVRNFAWNLPTPCIDTNIRRILHRCFVGVEHADGSSRVPERRMHVFASKVLTVAQERKISAADWHAALMDFGALICTKSSPKWEQFPPELRECFKAYGKQIQRVKNVNKVEPGRVISGRFVPNRLMRGRIVECLRDAPGGMSLDAIGAHVAVDWSPRHHRWWLRRILHRLRQDDLIAQHGSLWMLAHRRSLGQ